MTIQKKLKTNQTAILRRPRHLFLNSTLSSDKPKSRNLNCSSRTAFSWLISVLGIHGRVVIQKPLPDFVQFS